MPEEIDYEKIMLKCGLEIHQQLDTKKLFCNCPSLLRYIEPDFTIKRKLHMVSGESGEIDKAAKHEAEKDKEFIYQGYNNNTCLIDLDEEPPHNINEESLNIALQISILLNAKIIPLTQIMRKTVIDGSNTSGFQRTVLIAKNGYVETNKGKVRIESICLEEDSARTIEKSESASVYRLDRLGIPLIEITTSPDIKTPEQAKEVALHIGDILRSCKVKRGIGTIRQDVNLSIKNEKRVEIKGVQDIDLMIITINNEIKRQEEIINQNKKVESEVRNATPDGNTKFLRPMPGAARMYPETDLPFLKVSRDMINEAKKNLPKLRSKIEEELKTRGLNHEMIKLILQEKILDEFEALLKIYDNPNLIAKIIGVWKKEIATKENLSHQKINEILSIDVIENIINLVSKKKINENDVKKLMLEIVKGNSLEESIKSLKSDDSGIEERIMKMIKEKPGLNENAYMGLVMKEFKGKIDGKKTMEIIKKFIK